MEKGLENYIELVHFLGAVLPKHVEVVLQDVSTQSILAIEHGHVSGRQVGSPMTDYSLKVVSEGTWRSEPYSVNYGGRTGDGRALRSSTWFIRSGGELLGMLCINVDTQQYDSVCRSILALGGLTPEVLTSQTGGDAPAPAVESFHSNVNEMTQAVTAEITGGVQPDRLTQEEKVAVVAELDRRGTFLIKGAVSAVASQLGCSEASVYRYLTLIKQGKSGK